MLETLNLTVAVPKTTYKKKMPLLQERLRVLQQCALDAGIATVVVLEGWDASGKGTLVGRLVEKLDPRGFKVLPTYAPLVDELYRPWMWRFWTRLPAYGTIAVFDRSWYGRVLIERIEKVVSKRAVDEAFNEINDFERALVDDGQVIVKLWLHISKKEQGRRFRRCEKDPYQRWKIKPEDWRHHRQYKEYCRAIEEMLERTSTTHAPWTVVEAEDRRWAEVKVFSTMIAAIEARLKAVGKLPPPGAVGPLKSGGAAPPRKARPKARKKARKPAATTAPREAVTAGAGGNGK